MVFRERQTILKPVGLVTQPNAYGVYVDGALKRAENVTLRNIGELVQMPSTQGPVTFGVADGVISKLVGLDGGHVLAIVGSIASGSARPFAELGGYSFQGTVLSNPMLSFSPTGARVCSARLRERLTLNAPDACIVTDSMAPTVAGDYVFRSTGMIQPPCSFTTATNPGPIPPGIAVGYRMCLLREFADGYFIRSVPSPLLAIGNNAVASQAPRIYTQLNSAGLLVGDIVEVYRTDGVPITTTHMPSVGETLKRIASHPLTAADFATGYYLFTDTQEFVPGTNTTPGEELYTNPYQETEVYANRQPPVCQTLAVFKGYQFFGNTTDRPVLEVAAAGGFGNQAEAVAQGIAVASFKANAIGERIVTATRTSGSPTLTGVSASDLVGIKVGQQMSSTAVAPGFPVATAIVSINAGSGTITFAANATSNSAGPVQHFISDVLTINGNGFQFENLPTLLAYLSTMAPKFEVSTDAQAGYLIGSGESYIVGATLRIEPTRVGDKLSATPPPNVFTMSVTATNGPNYTPQLPEFGGTAKLYSATTLKNHLVWSKEQQPEHVPTAQEAFVGNGEIVAMNPTRDALWIWCTDGLYRLSGTAGANGLGWGLDVVSTTLLLSAPQASAVLGEVVFGYTNQGFVGVDSAGNVDYLTDQKIGNLLPGAQYANTRKIICEANETDDELLLGLGENSNTFSDVIWVYHAKQRGWTNIKAAAGVTSLRNITAMAMLRSTASGEPRLVFGVSPLGGASPSQSGWNGSTYLQCAAEYQPVYGDDPLSLKQYIWVDFIFASGGDGKTLVPLYNSIATGQITIADFQNSGYARSGVPRRFAVAHSLSVGFEQLVVGLEELSLVGQARFQGISIAYNTRTNQSKKR